jgi:hypothetical protein
MSVLSMWALFVLAPNVGQVVTIFATLLCLCAVIILIVDIVCQDGDESKNNLRLWLKRTIIWGAICFLAAACIPSKSEMALILANDYLSNNEQISQMHPKALKLLNKYLDEALETNETK